MNIRWGFIGCGEVTEKKSGPAFNEIEGSSVIAVMCRNAERARLYAERHNIPMWYTDAQALIDNPQINAVYIATPPSSHATYAIMAMRAGKAVYVEKPLAASITTQAPVSDRFPSTPVIYKVLICFFRFNIKKISLHSSFGVSSDTFKNSWETSVS